MLNCNFEFESGQSIKSSKNIDNYNFKIVQTNQQNSKEQLQLLDDHLFSVSCSEVDIELQKKFIALNNKDKNENKNELKMAVLWEFMDQNNKKIFGLSNIHETVDIV